MDWINRFRESGNAEPANPWDETVINGAPYDAHKAIRSNTEPLPAPGGRPEAIAEEIKRRQLAAVMRYIAAVRAR